MTRTLTAELYRDADADNWHFRVPALHIVGGGRATQEEAQRECLDAIAFALQGDAAAYRATSVAVTMEVVVQAA